ncbi:MAG: hypothetical protein U5R30_04655 [Deltaproteobacteria bacterium]|nr:hypothetical protein [Deltaproteobacteria bacterium]
MKTILKIAVIPITLVVMLMADIPLLPVQLVPEAHAILGVRRRTAVVVGATVHAADSAQMAQAQQQAAAAATPAPPPAGTGKPLPLGTVVSSLPAGCTSKPVGGVEYYHCGGNYYRAAFQGNSLVYVTAQP